MTTNGLYYEEHGSGEPLVLLHGGIGSLEMFAAALPRLAAARRVIGVDLPGHGRSPDVDRPLRPEVVAGDIAELISHLGLERADVLGYSLGGAVALRLAIQHPARVRRLVLVSIPFKRDGNFPEVIAAMEQLGPEAAEMMKPSPAYRHYARVAPDPDGWVTLIAKTAELLKVDYDWSEEVAELQPRTMLVYADADSVRPAHVAEFFGLLGGGLRDAGWDGSAQPQARMAVLPGRTHYDVLESPLLAPAVAAFLDAP
jgi:pimeloyl-ACP methyl ester carboxylesterase